MKRVLKRKRYNTKKYPFCIVPFSLFFSFINSILLLYQQPNPSIHISLFWSNLHEVFEIKAKMRKFWPFRSYENIPLQAILVFIQMPPGATSDVLNTYIKNKKKIGHPLRKKGLHKSNLAQHQHLKLCAHCGSSQEFIWQTCKPQIRPIM